MAEKTDKKSEFVDGCPIATQDIVVNLKNRQGAIDKANYGPMIPAEPNNGFWSAKAKLFGVPIAQAKRARCKNCAAFIQTPTMLDCIAKGVGEPDAWDVIDAGDLGYCDLFHFKCAAKRTCAAWIVGGPVTEESDMEEEDGND